jgi:hypothetical protein
MISIESCSSVVVISVRLMFDSNLILMAFWMFSRSFRLSFVLLSESVLIHGLRKFTRF